MPLNQPLAEHLVNFMNGLLAHDRAAISQLCLSRVQCGKALATHPTVQVLSIRDDATQSQSYHVGLLGLLNGLTGVYDDGPRRGFGALAAETDEDTGNIKKFYLLKNTESGA